MSNELSKGVRELTLQMVLGGLEIGIVLLEGALAVMRTVENVLEKDEDPQKAAEQPQVRPQKRPVRRRVRVAATAAPDYVVCLEDGKRFKTLKRHLRIAHGLTPEEYRAKWGDVALVAPDYADRRSKIARQIGLGRTRPVRGQDEAEASIEAVA